MSKNFGLDEEIQALSSLDKSFSISVEQLPGMISETDFGDEKLKIYIFSPERYAFEDDFYEVEEKVQLVALPAAIYDAYQKVLPKRKPQMLDIAEEKGGEA